MERESREEKVLLRAKQILEKSYDALPLMPLLEQWRR
jgi:hypothetical protein